MGNRFSNLIAGLQHKRSLNQWTRALENFDRLTPADQRDLLQSARKLRAPLRTFVERAEAQLSGPEIGQDKIEMPPQCDWAWRPDPWRGPIRDHAHISIAPGTEIGPGIKLFHDCPLTEMSFRQVRNVADQCNAPFGVILEVLGFNGSFLSMVFDLPDRGRSTTNRTHILRLDGRLRLEAPIEIFARLNVKHGPNTEQMVSELRPNNGKFYAEFDLGHAEMNEKRLENIWLDLIFDTPAMNQIRIEDMTLTRRPRAEI